MSQLTLLLSGLEHVECVYVAVIHIDFGIDARLAKVPDVSKCLMVKWFPVRNEGVTGRQAGIVGFSGWGSVFAYIRFSVQVAQIVPPAPMVAFGVPVAAVVIGR